MFNLTVDGYMTDAELEVYQRTLLAAPEMLALLRELPGRRCIHEHVDHDPACWTCRRLALLACIDGATSAGPASEPPA